MRILLVALPLLLVPTAARADSDNKGPYPIGLTSVTFTKPSETTGQPRELSTTIWYPAETATDERAPVPDAAVRRGRWPLILFSHGSCAFPEQSPFYTAGLARWGFVVAAPAHPGNTILDPGCMSPAALVDSFANRVADIEFVIDQLLAAARRPGSPFYQHLDPHRIGMTGHSFGGQTTLRVAALDPRIRGAVALAPATRGVSDRIGTPTMVISGELDSLTPFDTDARAAFALLDGPRFLVELLDTGHCAFALACVSQFCGRGCEPGTLPLGQAHAFTLRYAVPFFLGYVSGRPFFLNELLPELAPPGVVVVEAQPKR